MKVTQKKKTDDTIFLQCVASEKDVNRALDNAHIDFANQMGMRPQPNKTVAQAAEEMMGIKDLDSIVASSALESLIPMALNVKDIVPNYPPEPIAKSEFKRNHEFRFDMEVPLKPKYELTSYDPVEIKVMPFAVDENAVDQQLKQMAERYPVFSKDESKEEGREVQKGDLIYIALTAYENGKELTSLSTEGRPYQTGEGYMPEGFDENIYGMKVGETREFQFEGPSFDEDMNEITQKVDAKVTVLEFQKKSDPVVDDEWVKANMPMYPDAKSLRDDVRKGVERQAREQYDAYVMNLAAEAASRRFEGSIADGVYEAARDNMMRELRGNLHAQGKTWEQFVEEQGGEQNISIMMMIQIRQMIVQGYTLDAIYRHEGLNLTEEDIDKAAAMMNPQANPKYIRKQMEEAGRGFALRESAERLKANKWLVDHAIITEIDPAEAQTAEAVTAAEAEVATDVAADTETETTSDAATETASDE